MEYAKDSYQKREKMMSIKPKIYKDSVTYQQALSTVEMIRQIALDENLSFTEAARAVDASSLMEIAYRMAIADQE